MQYSYSTYILNFGEIHYRSTILNHLFEAEDLTELMKKVTNEMASKVSSRHSNKLINLVLKTL
jgi:hypothetical protein